MGRVRTQDTASCGAARGRRESHSPCAGAPADATSHRSSWPGVTTQVKPGTVVRQAVGISNRALEEMHLQFYRVPTPVTADEGVLHA